MTAFGSVAALAIGGAMLLADAKAAFVPVISMVGGIAALALANHDRLKLRMSALERREWRERYKAPRDRGKSRQTNMI